MTAAIAGLLTGTVVLIIMEYRRYQRNKADRPVAKPINTDPTIPDSPVSFGYKCMWFAVKTNDPQKLANLLEVKDATPCNWEWGIDKAYKDGVFITPVINGWTLACGYGLPTGDTPSEIKTVKNMLLALSTTFGEAQYFCTHRVVEYHCWMRAVDGNVTRVYAWLCEAGENIAVEGTPTGFEEKYTLINTFSAEAKDPGYLSREDITCPDEELIMKLAENWSIDPSHLEYRKDVPLVLGLFGNR